MLRLYLDGDRAEFGPPCTAPPPPAAPPNNEELPNGELAEDVPGCCIGEVGLPNILLRGGGIMGFKFGTDLPRANAFNGLCDCEFGPRPLLAPAEVCQAAFGGAVVIVGGGFDHC